MKIKSGSNLSKVRKNNYASILGTIYQQGPIMRSEIANQPLGITLPTVTTTIKQLLEDGILQEEPLRENSPSLGRKASLVNFAEDSGYAVGIEWSPVGIICCITNLRGKIAGKKKIAFDIKNISYREASAHEALCR